MLEPFDGTLLYGEIENVLSSKYFKKASEWLELQNVFSHWLYEVSQCWSGRLLRVVFCQIKQNKITDCCLVSRFNLFVEN